jgi:uncharacterized membrane protein HdeD (DUF308 family)
MEPLVIIIVAVVTYGIPIYLGVRAWRNGHRDWVWSIILATFGILGIMGVFISTREMQEGDYIADAIVALCFACLLAFYIITWVKTRKPLAAPIACPSCGKPSKVRQRIRYDQITGKKILSRVLGTISLIFGLATIILLFMGGGVIPLVAGIPAIGVGIQSFIRPTTQKLEYKCTGCRHKFIQ